MVFYIVLAILLVIGLGISGFLIYERQVSIKEIKDTLLDSQLIYENHKEKIKLEDKKHRVIKKCIDISLNVLLVVLALFFVIGLVDKTINYSPLPIKSVVIATGSMSTKNEKNEYLFENHLDNQIQVNDLIFLNKVDSLDEISLFDIICYRNEEGTQIVHRVVVINEDYLLTRGDANEVNDDIKIKLDDIVGKYNNVKIAGVGAITFFLSSDYGISTISIILALSLVYYFTKGSIEKQEEKRLAYLESEIKDSKNFVLISTSGTLEVKNDIYTFKENEAKEKEEMISTLTLENQTKTLQKGN